MLVQIITLRASLHNGEREPGVRLTFRSCPGAGMARRRAGPAASDPRGAFGSLDSLAKHFQPMVLLQVVRFHRYVHFLGRLRADAETLANE
jgi:hypothetical protein